MWWVDGRIRQAAGMNGGQEAAAVIWETDVKRLAEALARGTGRKGQM